MRQETSAAEPCSSRATKMRKRFSECCFSVANLALIVGALVALVVLVQFIQDEPLYEYVEHILSLAFYRQLIYVIVIVPLVLLVPIFNALSACFLSRRNASAASSAQRQQQKSQAGTGSSESFGSEQPQANVLMVKSAFEILLIILLFVALVFIGPNIRASPLASQIELQLRKHMKHRYENNFSYQFLDTLQQEYECCDELWYRSNLQDNLPVTCFVPDSNFLQVFDETCSDAIGSLVAGRCAIVAACLVVLLAALACLVAIDSLEWLAHRFEAAPPSRRPAQRVAANGQRYEFVGSDARHANSAPAARILRLGQEPDRAPHDELAADGTPRPARDGPPRRVASSRTNFNDERDDDERDDLLKADELVGRLKLDERDRLEPIEFAEATPGHSRPDDSPARGQPLEEHRASPTILARANYATVRRDHSLSPAHLDVPPDEERPASRSPQTLGRLPIKSALKKTSSFQRLNSAESSLGARELGDERLPEEKEQLEKEEEEDEEDESLRGYAERIRQNSSSLLRQQQTRRSLLNVRFADE